MFHTKSQLSSNVFLVANLTLLLLQQSALSSNANGDPIIGNSTDSEAVVRTTLDESIPLNYTRSDPNEGWLSAFPRPCSCQELTCGCCVAMHFNRMNTQRQYCSNLTYNPIDFAIELDVLNNTDSIYANHISGRNPPPMCMPIPNLPILAELCVQVFNVRTFGSNMNMCMDWLARIQRAPVFVMHFNCMRFGSLGVNLVKPHQVDEWPELVEEVDGPFDSTSGEDMSN